MTDEIRTESSTGGQKGAKLARFDLIPANPLSEIASRFGLGAMKYEDRNWERGYEWSKSYAALQRHAWAFWSGENDDDLGDEAFRDDRQQAEDLKAQYGRIPGSSHLAAIAQHAMFMLEWLETHPEFDDRVKPKSDGWKPDPKTETWIRNEVAKRAAGMRRRERLQAAAKEFDAELTIDAQNLSRDTIVAAFDGSKTGPAAAFVVAAEGEITDLRTGRPVLITAQEKVVDSDIDFD